MYQLKVPRTIFIDANTLFHLNNGKFVFNRYLENILTRLHLNLPLTPDSHQLRIFVLLKPHEVERNKILLSEQKPAISISTVDFTAMLESTEIFKKFTCAWYTCPYNDEDKHYIFDQLTSAPFNIKRSDQVLFIAKDSQVLEAATSFNYPTIQCYGAGTLDPEGYSQCIGAIQNWRTYARRVVFSDIDDTVLNREASSLLGRTVLNNPVIRFLQNLKRECKEEYEGKGEPEGIEISYLTARPPTEARDEQTYLSRLVAHASFEDELKENPSEASQQSRSVTLHQSFTLFRGAQKEFKENCRSIFSVVNIQCALQQYKLTITHNIFCYTDFLTKQCRKIDFIKKDAEAHQNGKKQLIIFLDDNSEEVIPAKSAITELAQRGISLIVLAIYKEGEFAENTYEQLFDFVTRENLFLNPEASQTTDDDEKDEGRKFGLSAT